MYRLKNILVIIFISGTFFCEVKGGNVFVNDSIPSKRYMNILVANGQVAINTMGVGVKYCGAWQLKKYPRLRIGPSVFYERIQFRKGIKLPRDVTEINISFTTPGLNIQMRVNKILSAQIGLSLLLGSEKITKMYYENTNPNPFGTPILELRQKTTAEGISGFQFEQNLLFLPDKTTGITFGLGLFERTISSSFYETDFGAKIYLGFYF
jgi:hypothetical protein